MPAYPSCAAKQPIRSVTSTLAAAVQSHARSADSPSDSWFRRSVQNSFQGLRASQWWTADQLHHYHRERILHLLRHCQQHVPYYRELMRPERLCLKDGKEWEMFHELPILARAEYGRHQAQFLASTLPSLTERTNATQTSGTTGIPVQVVQSNHSNIAWSACALRELEWSNIDPSGSMAIVRNLYATTNSSMANQPGYCINSSNWGAPYSDLMDTGPSFAMSIETEYEHQLAWLEEVNPHCLLTTASNLIGLVTNSAEPMQFPRLRGVRSISEALPSEVRNRITEQWGVPVWDLYSCEEAGYLATPCPDFPDNYHVYAENVWLEVLDEEGRACQPGQEGRVVITPLTNFVNPLLRYEIGDRATVGAPCPCGRGLPVLHNIVGKERPTLLLPDGTRKNSTAIASSLRKLACISQFQFQQLSACHVVLRIVPTAAWADSMHAQARSSVESFFGVSSASDGFRLDLIITDRIQPDAAGKIQSISTRV